MDSLETERLFLRNYTENDLDDYWEYVQMKNVGPRCGWEPYTDKQKAFERLKVEIAKPHQFAIIIKDINKVVGSIELMNVKAERYPNANIKEGAKEIGYLLSEKYWGKGYMTEAIKCVMAFAFDTLKVPQIFISHAEANIGSGRVQDKAGFKKIGRIKNYRQWVDGTMTDSICRCMTKREWNNLQRRAKGQL